VRYLDYRDARTTGPAAVTAYLAGIRDENFNLAYDNSCAAVEGRSRATFERNLRDNTGIASFAVDSAVPFRLTSPYAVRSQITEKDGNKLVTVFKVESHSVAGVKRMLVCGVVD
jgi:hypothetical protein